MAITLAQNFYKETVSVAWTAIAGNFYVTTKPTISEGYLVLSPNNSSLREIVKFTATGTDGTGDYVTVTLANRGLGGTTAQTHAIGEYVYINVTAETIQEISDALDQIVAGSAQDASTSTKGITKLNVAPASATEPIAVGINDTTQLPTTDEKAALAGAGASPDTSNKLLTQDDVPNVTLFPIAQHVAFTSSGTWTKDAGLKYIVVEVVGAGGGGGGNTSSDGCAGGGGGGGYSRKIITAASLGATETVTIGAAGTAGAGTGGTGGTGGTTSFGTHATAAGGSGGSESDAGGAGGVGASGDINSYGGSGAGGGSSNGGGAGGSSFFGGGAYGKYTTSNGTAGRAYGGGGGGASHDSAESGDQSGGAGAAGYVIVTEYYS